MIGTRLLDRYELGSELGRGGMGVVYRAHDRVLEREVAVKLLPAEVFTSEAQARFEREARLVAQMDHPAIVPIFDFGRHGGALFYVMPIVLGTTLHRLLKERALALGELVEIAAQVAEALDYSHQRGVIHRDVKPENVMVARTEGGVARVRVMDFGLAIDVGSERVTRTGNLPGTLAYLSPEQVLTQTSDARSDLYSLGTILYEGLAGQTPFGGGRFSLLYAIVHKPPPPLAGVDPALAAIVLGTLAKDPADRPQRGSELAAALRGWLGTLSVQTPALPPVGAARSDQRIPAGSPFVGRGAELAQLRRALTAAEAGTCQLAMVGGELGIGKTRLIEELAAEARERGVRVLRGRFSDLQSAALHQGFCELIQDYFRSKESERASSGLAEMREVACDLLAVFPVLREIEELRRACSDPERPSAVAEALKRGERSQLFELLARAFALIAAGRPLLLVLENLYEAEPLLETVDYLVRRLGSTPTLVVVTCRQSPGSRRHPLKRLLRGFEGDPRLSTLVLEPLAPAEHGELVGVLLGGEGASDELAARLYETSEGNPFFTQELVRALVESGEAVHDATGVWDLSPGAAAAQTLPETIQQVVEARIERLAAPLRRVLETASVLGRRFELPDLEAIAELALGAEEAAQLETSVETLVREGLLEEDRQTRGERLAFSSGVVQGVLYAGLPRRRRRQLHARQARHLEQRWAGRLERVYAQLVHHFSAADSARETVRYALELARLSLEATGTEDAVRALRVALELVDAEELEEPQAVEGELRHRLALAERLAGRIEVGAREAGRAARAFERAGEPPRAAAAARLAAELAWQGRQVEEARRWAEKGIELARAAEAIETLVDLLKLGATVANLRGDPWIGRAYLEEAEQLLRAARPAAETEPLPAGGVLVAALANPVVHLGASSFETVEEAEVLAHVFEPLLRFDSEGRLVPWLCESWQVLDGGRRFRFRLRPDVRFSDGRALDPAAFKRSFERAAREGGAARAAAFVSIVGTEDFLAGRAPGIAGIELCTAEEVCFVLSEPLPIFPALLSDLATAVTGEDGRCGTGPFRLLHHDPTRTVLERNPGYWRGFPPLLDQLEFRAFGDVRSIAAALRQGEVDLAHDLLPEDLEALLRDPKLGLKLVEATSKITYFAVFNATGPACRHLAVRRVMAGAVRVEDLVWRTLGRLAQPATGLIPPGVLGHDPGRRREVLGREQAAAELPAAGLTTPVRVRALIHPLLLDRYAALIRGLLEEWASLGIEVGYEHLPMEEFLARSRDFAATDLWLSRWVPNYDDPDIFTYRLLHSRHGYLGAYLGSAKADELMEKARQEERPATRRSLYRRLEGLLAEQAALLPLFHDVDYRVMGPQVRGLELLSSPPYVESTRLAKITVEATPPTEPPPLRRLDPIRVAVSVAPENLDPGWNLQIESAEIFRNVFETLIRLEDGLHLVPWLASQVRAEEGGRRYRIWLRPNVRFHDGRRLSSRDVRYSFERLMHAPWPGLIAAFLPVRGTAELQGERMAELAGIEIVSAEELTIELDRPFAQFPLILSSPVAAIAPEGSERFSGNWREGCAGTGPFRLVHLEPGERVELEANPAYWRPGLPRSPRLVFELGHSSAQRRLDLLAGRLELAGNFLPADFEALGRDPRFAQGYVEQPRFATYFLGFSTRTGPLADRAVRLALCRALDVETLVRTSLGRMVTPARRLIPPGLSGHDPGSRSSRSMSSPVSLAGLELRVAILPVFHQGQYAALWEKVVASLQALGAKVRVLWRSAAEMIAATARGEVDLAAVRWIATYPDTDALSVMLHPRYGYFGSFFDDPRMARMFDEGRYEAEPALRHAIYSELERLLEREAFLLPLFYEPASRFARPELRGLRLRLGWPEVAYEELELVG